MIIISPETEVTGSKSVIMHPFDYSVIFKEESLSTTVDPLKKLPATIVGLVIPDSETKELEA